MDDRPRVTTNYNWPLEVPPPPSTPAPKTRILNPGPAHAAGDFASRSCLFRSGRLRGPVLKTAVFSPGGPAHSVALARHLGAFGSRQPGCPVRPFKLPSARHLPAVWPIQQRGPSGLSGSADSLQYSGCLVHPAVWPMGEFGSSCRQGRPAVRPIRRCGSSGCGAHPAVWPRL